MVEYEAAAETCRSASEGKQTDPAPVAESTDHTTRRKSRKRKRVVPDIAARKLSEALSPPDVLLNLTEGSSGKPHLEIPVELNYLGYTSKNEESGATTAIAVVDAEYRESR